MDVSIFNMGVAALGVLVTMYVIMKACDMFEPAADYLGRNMDSGIKGATINAIGSSMPELFTGLAFLFTVSSLTVAEGFLAAVAVTAGSAVFNMVIIPALCILAVTTGKNKQADYIEVNRRVIWRDGTFLLAVELLLIVVLGFPIISWPAGLILIGGYVAYFAYLMWQHHNGKLEVDEDDDEDEDEPEQDKPLWKQIVTLDMISLVFKNDYTSGNRAWYLLGLSIVFLGVACHFLAESVILAADALNIPVYFASVILAAAATSVPDTVISVKDARKGNYDDAVSNAVGSNIFDVTVCTGVPLLLYGLIFGVIDMSGLAEMESDVQVLRIVLLGVSIAVIGLLLQALGKIRPLTAYIMIGMYAAWTGYIFLSATVL